jgi:hypothetical protein
MRSHPESHKINVLFSNTNVHLPFICRQIGLNEICTSFLNIPFMNIESLIREGVLNAVKALYGMKLM